MKLLHCFYCGEDLGYEVESRYDPYPSCGKRECERESRAAYQAEEDEARHRAEMDDYSLYR